MSERKAWKARIQDAEAMRDDMKEAVEILIRKGTYSVAIIEVPLMFNKFSCFCAFFCFILKSNFVIETSLPGLVPKCISRNLLVRSFWLIASLAPSQLFSESSLDFLKTQP
jgi:hypothetical protein